MSKPLTECPNCEKKWKQGSQERRLQICNGCGFPNHEEDRDDDDEDDFDPCNDCDCPDACADFGCAIQAGITRPPIGAGGIF